MSAALIKCFVGYRWADNILLKNISCEATSFWTPVSSCVGTHFDFIHTIRKAHFLQIISILLEHFVLTIKYTSVVSYYNHACLFLPNKVIVCGDPTINLTLAQIQYISGSAPAVTTYLAYSTIKCFVGYKWADLSLVKNVTCLPTSYWSPVAGCISKFLH